MNRRTAKTKPLWDMTTDELRNATKRFEQESLSPRRSPAPVAQIERHRRAMRKAGRPPVGQGAKRVLVTIERSLLAQTDALARRRGLSRSRLIAQGLETVLRRAG